MSIVNYFFAKVHKLVVHNLVNFVYILVYYPDFPPSVYSLFYFFTSSRPLLPPHSGLDPESQRSRIKCGMRRG